MKYGNIIDKRADLEKAYEYRKWVQEIPTLNFKEDYNVRIIPPFGGAIVRFFIEKDEISISVYLDCYDELGFYGEPYWEVYFKNCKRFKMKDTNGLLKHINKIFKKKKI